MDYDWRGNALAPHWADACDFLFDRLVRRFDEAKPERAIQLHSGGVVGRHLQEGRPQASFPKAPQRFGDQQPPQPQTAMFGGHAHILDRTDRLRAKQPVDRADQALNRRSVFVVLTPSQ